MSEFTRFSRKYWQFMRQRFKIGSHCQTEGSHQFLPPEYCRLSALKRLTKGGRGSQATRPPPMAMPLSHNCNIFIFIHTWVAKLQVFILLGQGLKPVEVQLHPDSALVPFPPSTESGKQRVKYQAKALSALHLSTCTLKMQLYC